MIVPMGGKNPRMTPSSAHLYTGKLGENKRQGPQTGKRVGWCGRLHLANIPSIPIRITEISNILPQPRGLTCQSQATASSYKRCNKSRRAHREESDWLCLGGLRKMTQRRKRLSHALISKGKCDSWEEALHEHSYGCD